MWASPKLNDADFEDQIERLDGIATRVRRGSVCICLDKETNQANGFCVLCSGWGHYYPPDRDIPDLKVIWQGHSAQAQMEQAGILTPGQIQVTWPHHTPLGYGDIFVHPKAEGVESSTLLVRGEVDPDGNSLERTRFDLVTGVEQVRAGPTVYLEGVDWQLAADGRTLEWLGAAEPAAGDRYSIRYRYRVQYIMDGAQQRERHDDGSLPWMATVTRLDSLTNQPGRMDGA